MKTFRIYSKEIKRIIIDSFGADVLSVVMFFSEMEFVLI